MNVLDVISIDLLSQNWLDNREIFLRIIISGILGLLIGWGRTNKHKPAGVKTYSYVTLSCTLITIISIHSAAQYSGDFESTMMDPMRLAAQIVTGLGFIGAGVILKDGLQVKGLTSAAMIFFSGGIGIGIGAGFYEFTIFAMITSMVISKIGSFLERKLERKQQKADPIPFDWELKL
ncbi:MgtC/SapB family protein [Paenibacillus nasutitermitis]|uniref:MgtC/SapB/SrpB/YhiD N-terminal domain-containing protein n=1 Tax=Paenibacillus nasutitermitis TaxID=1652958 RepID=A0A916YQW6_9BACL|nr:MgtC/SapB family protein [Paenibacillus nasutitermitis]GGD56862.1 hypothetical protein GCM10010911_13270 [Paenibacillus nasutitermitis]